MVEKLTEIAECRQCWSNYPEGSAGFVHICSQSDKIPLKKATDLRILCRILFFHL